MMNIGKQKHPAKQILMSSSIKSYSVPYSLKLYEHTLYTLAEDEAADHHLYA